MNSYALKNTAHKSESNIIQFPIRQPSTDETPMTLSSSAKITPMRQQITRECASEHKAEPIKKLSDINKICSFLLSERRYRDYMLFIVGINFGLRVSDLTQLRFCDLLNDDLTFKESFTILEKKTSKTRKAPKNRQITINAAVREAVNTYLEHTDGVSLSDWMFFNESTQSRSRTFMEDPKPLSRMSVDRILKGIARDCDIKVKMSTHTLRKTFGYHQMVMSNNDPRKLILLQKIFGHSSVEMTLEYIGVTRDEISEAYKKLNLGGRNYHMSK